IAASWAGSRGSWARPRSWPKRSPRRTPPATCRSWSRPPASRGSTAGCANWRRRSARRPPTGGWRVRGCCSASTARYSDGRSMDPTQIIDVIGIGADGAAGLRPDQVERILAADFLAGGERHLGYFPNARGERFVIRDNVVELVLRLGKRFGEQRCVVLASGDP